MDGAEELCDTGWLARLLAMPAPPTPPKGQKRCCAAPGGPLPDLFCYEVMPAMTSWPPVHKKWPLQAPPQPDGSVTSDRIPPSVAAVSPLPSSRDSTRVIGICSPMQNVGAGEAGSAHREARAHSSRAERAYRRVKPQGSATPSRSTSLGAAVRSTCRAARSRVMPTSRLARGRR